jgi:hypothetical protein
LKKIISNILSIVSILALSGCSAVSTLLPYKFDAEYKPEWSYCIEDMSGQMACSLWASFTNPSDSPEELSGCFYAVVDGETYKAEVTDSNTGCVSDVLNPGEDRKGGADFWLPPGKTIERVYVSPNPEEWGAIVAFDVGRVTYED